CGRNGNNGPERHARITAARTAAHASNTCGSRILRRGCSVTGMTFRVGLCGSGIARRAYGALDSRPSSHDGGKNSPWNSPLGIILGLGRLGLGHVVELAGPAFATGPGNDLE